MTEREKIKLINKNGGRYLANFAPEEITEEMCWAALNKDVSALSFVPQHLKTPYMIDWCIERRVSTFTSLSDEEKTPENSWHAVGLDGMMLQYVPESLLTDDLIFRAVNISNKPQAIKFIPEKRMTPAFAARVINHSSDCISYLPLSFKTREFYTVLVEEDPSLFRLIPKKFRTAALCKLAIDKMGYASAADAVAADPSLFFDLHPGLYDHDSCMHFVQAGYLDFRPGHGLYGTELCFQDYTIDLKKVFKWPDVCQEAVKRNRYAIRAILEEMITPELCSAAIKADPYAFELIPEKHRTAELCILAVQQNADNLKYIPNALQTVEMRNHFEDILENKDISLDKIPYAWRTRDLCKKALLHGSSPNDVPKELINKDLALWIITNVKPWTEGHAFLHVVPEHVRDQEVCLAAVKKAGGDLCDVPAELRTYDICLAAAKQSANAIRYIPYEQLTPDIVLAISEKGVWANFMEIPEEKLTAEACKALFRNWQGTVLTSSPLEAIPKQLIDQEMSDLAFQASAYNFPYIPANYITEEMFITVAKDCPGLLGYHEALPSRFTEAAFLRKVRDLAPNSEMVLSKIYTKAHGNQDTSLWWILTTTIVSLIHLGL